MIFDAGNAIESEIERDGYAVSHMLLEPSRIAAARRVAEQKAGAETSELLATEILANEVLLETIFNADTLGAVRAVLGDRFQIFPNFTLRANVTTPWHADRAFVSIPRKIESQHRIFLQCGIYLQDNDQQCGGGLDVRPGSHEILRSMRTRNRLLRDAMSYARSMSFPPKTLMTNSCDMMMWDGRIFHRGTPSRQKMQRGKYALYFSATKYCDEHADYYLSYLHEKALKRKEISSINRMRFSDMANISYSNDFPDEVRNLIQSFGGVVRTMSGS